MGMTLEFIYVFFKALIYVAPILIFLCALIFTCAFAFSRLDNKPIKTAIYMAFITALTIGYGDVTPSHPASRVLAILLGIIGMIFTGIIVAIAVYATQQSLKTIFV